MGRDFEPPYGIDNPSGIWKPGKTPKFLLATVGGVSDCPGAVFPCGPPNRTYCLEQVNSTWWVWEGIYYDVGLRLSALDSLFQINCDAVRLTWFLSYVAAGKVLHFHNQQSCAIPVPGGYGGEATVDPTGAVCYPTALMKSMNLFPDTSKMKWDPVGPDPVKQYVFGHKHNEIQCIIKHDGY